MGTFTNIFITLIKKYSDCQEDVKYTKKLTSPWVIWSRHFLNFLNKVGGSY